MTNLRMRPTVCWPFLNPVRIWFRGGWFDVRVDNGLEPSGPPLPKNWTGDHSVEPPDYEPPDYAKLYAEMDCKYIEDEDEDTDSEDDEELAPRKRGRPRKAVPNVVQPPRKRGRPRKNPLPPLAALAPTIKRGRGRPRKHPLLPVSSPKPLADERLEEKLTEGSFALFPSELMDLNEAGALDVAHTDPEVRDPILALARRKLQLVQSGQFQFGHPVVIPSFEARDIPNILPTILSNIVALNVLCSQSALDTRHGKVSVFPVTVYLTSQQAATQQGGYPCLALHVAHFKVLCWRVFSACRKIVNNSTLVNGLSPVTYKFQCSDDHDLTVLAGVEQYTTPALHAVGGFLLLPAQWLDVMKHFFVTPNMDRHDIGELFRTFYAHRPNLKDKFRNEFRSIWLGGQRTSNVNSIIRLQKPFNDHTFSMTRCRAASGEAKVGHGKAGNLWVINPPKTHQPVRYTPLTFCYGVQCWREQLQVLNSACVYLTATSEAELVLLPQPQPRHMSGLLTWTDDAALTVKTRAECVAYGIHDDTLEQTDKELVCHLRNARAALVRQYGKSIVTNFFGLEVSNLQRISTVRAQKQNPENKESDPVDV